MSTPGRAPAVDPDSVDALIAKERDELANRRRVAGVDQQQPVVGLALSGGGIRSATFCLGVLRSLARGHLLSRFDYLSTVSGGGYIGSAFGRLFADSKSVEEVRQALADGRSLWLWWLRRNGRFLMPAGIADLWLAIATFLRSMIAVHVELAMLALLFGLVLAVPHLLHYAQLFPTTTGDPRWQTLWWPVALLPVLTLGPAAILAYWFAHGRMSAGAFVRNGLMLLVLAGICAATAWRPFTGPPADPSRREAAGVIGQALVDFGPTLLSLSLTLGAVLGLAASAVAAFSAEDTTLRFRNRATRALRAAVRFGLLMLFVGFVDLVSWRVLRDFGGVSGQPLALSALTVVSLLALAARLFIEPLQALLNRAGGTASGRIGRHLVSGIGLLLALVWLVLWSTVAQALIFDDVGPAAWARLEPVPRWFAVGAVVALWWLLTGSDKNMANATSLHHFYHARLTRAYVSTGNASRFLSARWAPADEATTSRVRRVGEVIAGDDVALADYRPECKGGPIHLVNVCVNQTRDDQREALNSDRKGLGMSVSARGFEVGPSRYVRLGPSSASPKESRAYEIEDLSLGQWVAISGAAMSAGRGANTGLGSALLLFLFGVRLGYWWRAPRPTGERSQFSIWDRIAWRAFGKGLMLTSEATADFRGTTGKAWYLSDGGHFENTGVYPLIKRKLDFIVLVDCGADPKYEFGDLANLVLKAKVDFDARIEFYERDEARHFLKLPIPQLEILSPGELADSGSRRGVLLARITYADGSVGTLLVIKPNLHSQMGLDVQAYAQAHAVFPQEATSDQFFDEAQWESYHQLGADLGSGLSEAWLQQLPGWSDSRVHQLTHPAILRGVPVIPVVPTGPAAEASVPAARWRGAAAGAAVGTTLGLGASLTLLTPAWNLFDQVSQARQSSSREAERLFREAVDAWNKDRSAAIAHYGFQLNLIRLRDLREDMTADTDLTRLVDRFLTEVERQCSAAPGAGGEHCGRRSLSEPHGVGPLYYWNRPGSPAVQWLWARLAERIPGPVATAPSIPVPQRAGGLMDAPSQAVATAGAVLPAPSSGEAQRAAQSACSPSGDDASTTTPITVYWQIYAEADRTLARQSIERLRASGLKLQFPGIEDVTATARRKNRRPPGVWPDWTVIYHDEAGGRCARELAATLARIALRTQDRSSTVRVQPLPSTLKPSPGVIEIWIPPGGSGSTGGGW